MPVLETIESIDQRLFGSALTRRILACALSVHRELGPGLLESTYRSCLVHELRCSGLPVSQEVNVPVIYKGVKIDCGYRADIVVQEKVLLELKTVERLLPIHDAQMLTYLKLSGLHVGLLMNFNAINLRHGL